MHMSEVYSTHTLKMHIQTQRHTQNICIHRDDICGMLLHGCDQWENSTIAKIVGQMMFAQNSDILIQSWVLMNEIITLQNWQDDFIHIKILCVHNRK